MASGDSYSQVHTSDLDVTEDSIKTNGSGMSHNGPVSFPLRQTKLLVRSYNDALAVEDLWPMFSLYGEVSNIISEGHGATITYKDQCSFPGLDSYMEMEMILGGRKVFVTNLSLMDVSQVCHYPQGQEEIPDYSQYQTQQMTGGYLQDYPPTYAVYPNSGQPLYYPHHPPPLSPHYDTAILDVGQPNAPYYQPQPQMYPFTVPPPPIVKNQTNVFSFETLATEAAKTEAQGHRSGSSSGGCHVCSGSSQTVAPNKLQPLTPITPTYQPPPSFSVPPPPLPQYWLSMTPPPPSFQLPTVQSKASSTLLTLSGSTLLSSDSSTSMLPIGSEGQEGKQVEKEKGGKIAYHYFTSPYKKFSKFQGVPTPAKFPLNSGVVGGRNISRKKTETSSKSASAIEKRLEDEEDKSSWYQAGDKWGYRRTTSISQVTMNYSWKQFTNRKIVANISGFIVLRKLVNLCFMFHLWTI